MDNYFYQHVRRKPFKNNWPAYYKQLTYLLAGKMAEGNYAALINNALNENSLWNMGISRADNDSNIKVNNHNIIDGGGNLNLALGLIERSPSGTLFKNWSMTPLPASSSAFLSILTPSTLLYSLSVAVSSLIQLLSSAPGAVGAVGKKA